MYLETHLLWILDRIIPEVILNRQTSFNALPEASCPAMTYMRVPEASNTALWLFLELGMLVPVNVTEDQALLLVLNRHISPKIDALVPPYV